MNIVQIVIMISVLFILSLITIVVLVYEWSLLVTRAPFVGLPKDIIPEIFKELNLTEDSVLYDLGCGDGRVLFYCEKRLPKVKCIGIDKALAARVVFIFKKMLFYKKSNVVFLHKNMFKHDLSDATHIFVYLFPGLMNSLFDKLKKELKPGAIVISCDFEFKDKKPSRIVNLNRSKHLLGQRLLIYEF